MPNLKNSCNFAGRIINDPEISTIQSANGPISKATFTIAVDRNLTAQQRQAVKNGDTSIVRSDFVNLSAIGKLVDNMIAPYCKKGVSVLVMCRYTTYNYMDQASGQKKYGHNFDIDQIEFCPQNAKNAQNTSVQQQPQGGFQNNNGSNFMNDLYGNQNQQNLPPLPFGDPQPSQNQQPTQQPGFNQQGFNQQGVSNNQPTGVVPGFMNPPVGNGSGFEQFNGNMIPPSGIAGNNNPF